MPERAKLKMKAYQTQVYQGLLKNGKALIDQDRIDGHDTYALYAKEKDGNFSCTVFNAGYGATVAADSRFVHPAVRYSIKANVIQEAIERDIEYSTKRLFEDTTLPKVGVEIAGVSYVGPTEKKSEAQRFGNCTGRSLGEAVEHMLTFNEPNPKYRESFNELNTFISTATVKDLAKLSQVDIRDFKESSFAKNDPTFTPKLKRLFLQNTATEFASENKLTTQDFSSLYNETFGPVINELEYPLTKEILGPTKTLLLQSVQENGGSLTDQNRGAILESWQEKISSSQDIDKILKASVDKVREDKTHPPILEIEDKQKVKHQVKNPLTLTYGESYQKLLHPKKDKLQTLEIGRETLIEDLRRKTEENEILAKTSVSAVSALEVQKIIEDTKIQNNRVPRGELIAQVVDAGISNKYMHKEGEKYLEERQEKAKKVVQEYAETSVKLEGLVKLFNESPTKALKEIVEYSRNSGKDPQKEVAKFFSAKSEKLNKESMTRYLLKEPHLLLEYSHKFTGETSTKEEALGGFNKFINSLSIPKEVDDLEKIIDGFSNSVSHQRQRQNQSSVDPKSMKNFIIKSILKDDPNTIVLDKTKTLPPQGYGYASDSLADSEVYQYLTKRDTTNGLKRPNSLEGASITEQPYLHWKEKVTGYGGTFNIKKSDGSELNIQVFKPAKSSTLSDNNHPQLIIQPIYSDNEEKSNNTLKFAASIANSIGDPTTIVRTGKYAGDKLAENIKLDRITNVFNPPNVETFVPQKSGPPPTLPKPKLTPNNAETLVPQKSGPPPTLPKPKLTPNNAETLVPQKSGPPPTLPKPKLTPKQKSMFRP